MIKFRSISDTDPALAHSPIVRAAEKTFAYIDEHGPIGLTPSKAFKRVFVHWAAAEFDWPGYSEADLFAVNKVLNELDFPPLMDLHDLMIALKIGRHFKGQFRLTKAGQSLVGQPGRVFGILTPFFLFELDHVWSPRPEDQLMGNWDIFLNVLNVETEDGATGGDIRRALYGEPDPATGFDQVLSNFYIQVLRPLCWAGLLHEYQASGEFRTEQRLFTKTPLWRAALSLDTDNMVRPAIRH
jgi:hypothetical protein